MGGTDDVVDGVEQGWIVSENLVDASTAPLFGQEHRIEPAAHPRGADSANCAIDDGIAAFDRNIGDRLWVKAARRERTGDHVVAIAKRLFGDLYVVHLRPFAVEQLSVAT